MIEIVFSESAAGSLKIAMGFGKGKYAGGCASIFLYHKDGREATAEEIEAARREMEERNHREWKAAVPFAGNAGDVFGFSLALSFGDISEENFWKNREEALLQLACWPGAADMVCEWIKTARKNLQSLLERAKNEAVRIWYSDNPDEACGMCWMMAQLAGNCPEVYLVKLPEKLEKDDEIRCFTNWAEVGPAEWGRFQAYAEKASPMLRRYWASAWKEIQAENLPLRAVLNGKMHSIPEDIYDSFIRREMDAQPEEFHQARLIGNVIGKYALGIGDGFIAQRMEKMIQDGELIPATEAEEIPYRRMLRKTDKYSKK